MTDKAQSPFETTKATLLAEAPMGHVDAFEMAVRTVECAGIAAALRSVAGNESYSLGKIDPAILRQVADEIERWH